MGEWLDKLRRETREPLRDAPTKPTKGAFVGFGSMSQEGYQQNENCDEMPISVEMQAEESVHPDYRPAGQTAQEGHRQPKKAEGLKDAKTPAACRCCGRSAWWTKASGQRVCGVCHPEPRQPQV